MTREIISFFSEGEPKSMVDGTAGQGGHLSALLSRFPDAAMLAIDRDPEACALLRERFGSNPRLSVHCHSFADLPAALRERGLGSLDCALFDLGLSSAQLDDPDRGFSHSDEGPLDMRFDRSAQRLTAFDIVNGASERELADILFQLGEERSSRRLARRIVRNRPISSTSELADVIRKSVGPRCIKTLSRVFQALRIAVNSELEELERLLGSLGGCLRPGGRDAFLTFHSLEDRLVKLLFRDSDEFRQDKPPFRTPAAEEIEQNPRARSAKLRTGFRA